MLINLCFKIVIFLLKININWKYFQEWVLLDLLIILSGSINVGRLSIPEKVYLRKIKYIHFTARWAKLQR